jgi:hypothetical protein
MKNQKGKYDKFSPLENKILKSIQTNKLNPAILQ